MIDDQQILNNWYHYAAGAKGFIGAALKSHQSKASITQEQQRILLQIQGERYDQFWLQLQAMLIPRASQFETDLQRIVADVRSKAGVEADVNMEQLMVMVRTGLEP